MADLEKSIIEELPQIPYIQDQVGEAIKWAKEALTKSEYTDTLRVALDVAKYAKESSDPNFFKTHLVVASILAHIPEAVKDERFSKFDTASKAVEKALIGMTVSPTLTEGRGCFKAIMLTLAPLARKNEDYFAAMLIGIKQELENILKGMAPAGIKTPITPKDYIVVLGYANVVANLKMANLKLLDRTYKIFNEIEIMLNNSFNY